MKISYLTEHRGRAYMRREGIRQILFTLAMGCLIAIPTVSYAFIPLESIIFGNIRNNQKNAPSSQSFLDSIYTQPNRPTIKKSFNENKKELAYYRSHYTEGAKLKNYCQSDKPIEYSNFNDRINVKRSTLATFQYLGLDISTNAIATYAKKLNYTKNEYENMVNYMVGSYCSSNMSVISHKKLRNNMISRFNGEGKSTLPSIQDNSFFYKKSINIVTSDKALKQGLGLSLDLFKSFCSWGGDVEDLRLMVPLVRTPQIMSFVFRQMTGQRMQWSSDKKKVVINSNENGVHVVCRDLICRREEKDIFYERTPRSIGSISIRDDLNRLYCEDFSKLDFVTDGQVPKLKKFIKKWTFDEQNLMVSQFLSLSTGVPNFWLNGKSINHGKNIAESNIDLYWDSWARKLLTGFDQKIFYEEPLTIELVDKDLYFNPQKYNFSVEFDINMGEFDRINQRVGKISTSSQIRLSKSLIRWSQLQLAQKTPEDPDIEKRLKHKLHSVINPQVDEFKKKFQISPWQGDLSRLIVNALLDQFSVYRTKIYNIDEKGIVSIPLRFNYAPFALKYMNNLFRTRENQKKQREEFKFIESNRLPLNAGN